MSWQEYALDIAKVAAKKSKDPWRKVGACLLRHDNTVAGVGFNGFPAGMREDWQDRDKRRLYIVHAEQNALRYVKPNECGLIAVTLLPCNDCLKAIASHGIKTVVYQDIYDRDATSIELAKDFGVELVQIGQGDISGSWDHRGKPSVFTVRKKGLEIYRGNFRDGYKLLNK
jgi:dCMP deaminase